MTPFSSKRNRRFGVALPEKIQVEAIRHLIREDGQEDLCFALWHPSQGHTRQTALIHGLIVPNEGDRNVHGNASFNSVYLARAIAEATKAKAGLAFMHSHPITGWQGMSLDDINAEMEMAPLVLAATGIPLVGMTMGTEGAWSARFWQKEAPKKYQRHWCESVRVVGRALHVTYMEKLRPRQLFKEELTRTISAWGEEAQADLARLRIGIVGLGSVGSIVAETLARMGIQHLKGIDFDRIEFLNLDRILHSTAQDAKQKRYKVEVIAEALKKSATADNFEFDAVPYSLAKKEAFRKALDCDVIFSCVDRPLARSILNFIAYAHLIPVVDGGIRAERNSLGQFSKADWKAHIASPDRRCLECLGQYDPGFVATEREGRLDDPSYIQGLPEGHELRRNQNVFAFSLSLASMEVLQMLMMVVSPLGIADMGEQIFHFVPGDLKTNKEPQSCGENCLYPDMLAMGDHAGIQVTDD